MTNMLSNNWTFFSHNSLGNTWKNMLILICYKKKCFSNIENILSYY